MILPEETVSATNAPCPIRLSISAFQAAIGHRPDDFVAVCDNANGIFKSQIVRAFDAEKSIAQIVNTADIFIKANPVRGPERKNAGSGTAEEVTRLATLLADLDEKTMTIDTAKSIIADLSELLGTRPAVITHSGHGWHPYWPVLDGNGTTADLRATGKRWGRAVQVIAGKHGCAVDSVFDLPRIMRAPDTLNNKNADAVVPVVAYRDTGQPLPLDVMRQRLHDAGIRAEEGDGDQTRIFSDPGNWALSENTCGYMRAVIGGIPADGPKETDGGRHQWMVNQAVRCASALRVSCLSEADWNTAAELIDDRLRELRAETGDKVPNLEVPSAFLWGVARAATKPTAQLWKELGDHSCKTKSRTRTYRPLRRKMRRRYA